jgi:hypothetical protein
MKPNHMKAKLLSGKPALGCSLMFPSPQIVEMLVTRASIGCCSIANTVRYRLPMLR